MTQNLSQHEQTVFLRSQTSEFQIRPKILHYAVHVDAILRLRVHTLAVTEIRASKAHSLDRKNTGTAGNRLLKQTLAGQSIGG